MNTAWTGLLSWSSRRIQYNPKVITPIRFLWQDYIAYCYSYGYEACDAQSFMVFIEADERLEIKIGGFGRVRRMIVGLELRKESAYAFSNTRSRNRGAA